MRFAESENAYDVLAMLKAYVLRYGIPREFYVDFGSVYHAKKNRLTDVSRALSRLGVNVIHAHSPQAKGRVERSNRTHQDRLVKASADTTSPPSRMPTAFSRTPISRSTMPASPGPIISPISTAAQKGIDLNNIFCFETTRYVNHDYTITLSARYIQLLNSPAPLPPPCHHVTLRRWLDDSLHIFWNDHELDFKHLTAKPKPKPQLHPPAVTVTSLEIKIAGAKRNILRAKNETTCFKP